MVLNAHRNKHKKVETNAYLFEHGHTVCTFSENPLYQAIKRHFSNSGGGGGGGGVHIELGEEEESYDEGR